MVCSNKSLFFKCSKNIRSKLCVILLNHFKTFDFLKQNKRPISVVHKSLIAKAKVMLALLKGKINR